MRSANGEIGSQETGHEGTQIGAPAIWCSPQCSSPKAWARSLAPRWPVSPAHQKLLSFEECKAIIRFTTTSPLPASPASTGPGWHLGTAAWLLYAELEATSLVRQKSAVSSPCSSALTVRTQLQKSQSGIKPIWVWQGGLLHFSPPLGRCSHRGRYLTSTSMASLAGFASPCCSGLAFQQQSVLHPTPLSPTRHLCLFTRRKLMQQQAWGRRRDAADYPTRRASIVSRAGDDTQSHELSSDDHAHMLRPGSKGPADKSTLAGLASAKEGGNATQSQALASSLSAVSSNSGRMRRTNKLVLGSDNGSEESWRMLDKALNQYPAFRTFTVIGTGGQEFR